MNMDQTQSASIDETQRIPTDTLILSRKEDESQDSSDSLTIQVGGNEYRYSKPLLTSKENWKKRLDVVRKTQEDFNRPRPQHIPEEKWTELQEQRKKGLRMLANARKDPLYMGSESQRGYTLLMDVQFQERQLAGDIQAAKEITDRSLAEMRSVAESELQALEPQYEEKRRRVLEIKTAKEQKEQTLKSNEQKLAEIPSRRQIENDRLKPVLKIISGNDTETVASDGKTTRRHEAGLQEKYNQARNQSQESVTATQKRERGHTNRWEKEYRKQYQNEQYDSENESLERRLQRLQRLEQIWIQREQKAFLKGRARKSLELIRGQLSQTLAAIEAKKNLDIAVNQLNTIRENIRTIGNDENNYRTAVQNLREEVQTMETQYRTEENDLIRINLQLQERRRIINRADNMQNQRQAS